MKRKGKNLKPGDLLDCKNELYRYLVIKHECSRSPKADHYLDLVAIPGFILLEKETFLGDRSNIEPNKFYEVVEVNPDYDEGQTALEDWLNFIATPEYKELEEQAERERISC